MSFVAPHVSEQNGGRCRRGGNEGSGTRQLETRRRSGEGLVDGWLPSAGLARRDFLNRRDESIAVPRRRHDVTVVGPALAERPAQRRYGLVEVVLLDKSSGPDREKQLLFWHEPVPVCDKHGEGIERLRTERDCHAVLEQQAPGGIHREFAEGKGRWHRRMF